MDGSRFDDLTRTLGKGVSRRKMFRGLAGGLAGALVGGTMSRRAASARSLTICHATGNPDAPWQTMVIDQSEFNLHARHGDYLRVECCGNIDCSNPSGACGSGVCQNGYCVQLPIAAGSPCDTGLACSANAVCDGAFTCVGSPVVCAETDNPCTTAVCSESGGGCQEVPIDDGTTCGTGDACSDFVCASGSCLGVPKTSCTGNCADCGGACVDRNSDPNNCQTCGHACAGNTECTVATCNGGSCGTTPANEGGNCTTEGGVAGTCVSGVCHQVCPAGETCRFSHFSFPNAIGICANGECTCIPLGVAGMCNCNDINSVAGCCGGGCVCPTGTCL